MASNIIYALFSTVLFWKTCNGRYVVPGRPAIDLKNTTGHHPEAEFRDHALRVGNIIADLLRSELRLMLSINSTIANGKKHHHSENKSNDHHLDKELGEEAHSTESKSIESFKSEKTSTSEESHVAVFHHVSKPDPAGKQVHSQKEENAHSHEPMNKNEEDKIGPKKVSNCDCPNLKNVGAQPNTVLLEQKFYGALLSNGPLQPIIVQRFILNPSNLTQASDGLHQEHGKNIPQVHTNPVTLKPSTTAGTTNKAPNDNHSSGETSENKKHNINSHSHHIVPEPTASGESTLEPPKRTTYNPLAEKSEGTNKNDALDLPGEQTTENDGNYLLGDENTEMENQIESPSFDLEETSVTENPPEEVKEEAIHVHVQNVDEY